jgi:hypothetical protein
VIVILGGVIGIYIKTLVDLHRLDTETKVELAKVDVRLTELNRDLLDKELAICRLEDKTSDKFDENKEDHKEIIQKIDKLVSTLIK